MNSDYYINLITSQFRKDKFKAWVESLIQPFVDAGVCAESMFEHFDIDNAVGAQQDILGAILGVSRVLPYQPISGDATLSDEDYRIVLKAKVIQNQWDGKITSLHELWGNLFADSKLSVIDNQDMTMSIVVTGSFSPVIEEMIDKGLIVPKPQAVGVTTTVGALVFAYDISDANNDGYDAGYWG